MTDHASRSERLPEARSSEHRSECANCEEPIDQSDWHPVSAVEAASGCCIEIYPFCSAECRIDRREGN